MIAQARRFVNEPILKELSCKLADKTARACYTLRMNKNVPRGLLCLLALAMLSPLPARADGASNYTGRRITRAEGNFSAIGVKVEESAGGFLLVSVYFNDALESSSVQNRRIFVDGAPLPPVTQFQFAKSRRLVQFRIRRTAADGAFSLRLVQLCAYDGRAMHATELSGLEAGTFFKFSREERAWQESSL